MTDNLRERNFDDLTRDELRELAELLMDDIAAAWSTVSAEAQEVYAVSKELKTVNGQVKVYRRRWKQLRADIEKERELHKDAIEDMTKQIDDLEARLRSERDKADRCRKAYAKLQEKFLHTGSA